MDPITIINILSGLATLYAQEAPLIAEFEAAYRSGDQAALDALLVKVQAANDELGKA